MNVCSWTPAMVTLVDGRLVSSDSAEWLAECEARHMLSFPVGLGRDQRGETRAMALERIEKKRGPEAAAALKARMDECEPAFVLAMRSRERRNMHIDAIRRYLGENHADHLKSRVIALHKARAESDGAASAA